MGLFDKIKDNAKTISMKAIEATREYDEEYLATQAAEGAVTAAPKPEALAKESTPAKVVKAEAAKVEAVKEVEKPEVKEEAPKPEPKAEEPAPEPVKEVKKEEPKEEEKPEYKEPQPVLARRSRIMEIPKDKANYTPHYKSEGKATKKEESKESAPASTQVEVKQSESQKSVTAAPKKVGIIDITPQKVQDPVKRAMYARERAALAALSSQRRLNGTVAIYATNHMNFKTRVYINRIEYSGSFGKNTLPVEQIAWVKLRAAGTGVIIETTEGKRVVMVIKPKDRLAFADAVLKVQEMQPKRGKFKDTQTVRIDQLEKINEGVDEIEKLAKLYDKGILTQEEFDTKKRQILGI